MHSYIRSAIMAKSGQASSPTPTAGTSRCCSYSFGSSVPLLSPISQVFISVRSNHDDDASRLEKYYLGACIILAVIYSITYAIFVRDNAAFMADFLSAFFVASWILKFFPQSLRNAHRKTARGISMDSAFFTCLSYMNFAIYEVLITSVDYSDTDYNAQYKSMEGLIFLALSTALAAASVIQMYHLDGWYDEKLDGSHAYGINKLASKTLFLITVYCQVQLVFLLLILFSQKNYDKSWLTSLLISGTAFGVVRHIPQIWRNYLDVRSNNVSFASISMELLGSVALLALIVHTNVWHTNAVTGFPDDLLQASGSGLTLSIIAIFTSACNVCLLLQIYTHRERVSNESLLSENTTIWQLQSALIQSVDEERASLVLPDEFVGLDGPSAPPIYREFCV